MKKVVFSMLFFSLSNIAIAADISAIGADANGVPLTDKTETLYVVHGGCREYINNRKLTDIWLYFSTSPNVPYDPNQIGKSILDAQMFLNAEFGSRMSVAVCNGLRNAHKTQAPVQVSFKIHPYWKDSYIVESVRTPPVDAIDVTGDQTLLKNFSIPDRDTNNCRK